ncbi:MAG: DNA adenine methylase [Bacteroidales bacterium]|jgi:adenine-specific DNA-methyltransferase|nr:DNA adenine methylase [Bacteroidales bacterium]
MNYIGCKYKLLPFVYDCIHKITKDDKNITTFCDIFAGTGVVGSYFKQKGYKIIANDLQYYSYVLNQQYIKNHTTLLFKGLEEEIPLLRNTFFDENKTDIVCNYLNNLEGVAGFIFKNFCKGDKKDDEDYRLYFSDNNGKKCDAIRQKIEYWKNNNIITNNEYYFLLATLLENIDKVANTASVYGAFLKKLKASANKSISMTPAKVIINKQEHRVFNEDANKLIRNIETDILYLDPPYNQRQYSSNYHILETIAKYDNPTIIGKTGMRDCSNQKSMYCQKQKVKEVFSDLINNAKTKYIFLSYNNEGLMSFEEIKQIMEQRGKYGFFEKTYSRFKADKESENRHIKANQTKEYIHYLIVKNEK